MIANRIEAFLNEINMSPSLFADAIGVQRATISHILSGRNNPSLDFVQKVLSRFPKLNPDWILSGKGGVWRESDKNEPLEDLPKVLAKQNLAHQPALFDDIQDARNTVQKEVNSRVGDTPGVSSSKRILQDPLVSGSLNSETPVNESHKKTIQKVIILYTDQTFEAFTEF